MASWIENQPVFFGEEGSCSCDGDLPAQLVDNGDKTQVQFLIEPCDDEEQLIPDPNFEDPYGWTLGDNWTVEDDVLCLSGDSVTGDSTLAGNPASDLFTTGSYYQINITVDSMTSGSLGVYCGSTLVGTITTLGTHTFYGIATDFFGIAPFYVSALEDGTNVCISNVTAYIVRTEVILAIYNSDGVYQTQINPTANPDSFTTAQNTITATVDWAALNLSNGCFYLCLLDPCENTGGQNYEAEIDNCSFEKSDFANWEAGDFWTPVGSTAVGVHPGDPTPTGANTLVQEDIFPFLGNSYCIDIVISAITGDLNIFFGTVLVATLSTTGTHTVCGTPDVNSITLALTPEMGCTVDSVCPHTVTDFTCNAQSNTFKLGSYSSQCTLLINACNDEDGMGFVFDSSGFSPRIRLEAKLKQATYPSDRNSYEDSAGSKSNYFYKRRKAKYLCTDLQPEYVHDFLSLLVGFDRFYIDDIEYIVEDDEYEPEYSDASDSLGKAKILVSVKTQNVKNVNCTGAINECILDGDFLLQADDSSQFITLVGGEKIKISG